MDSKTIFLLLITVIVAGIIGYILIFGLTFEGKESDFYVPAVTGDNIPAYKESCVEINLTKVEENPEGLIGQKVKVTGRIYNKIEGEDFGKVRTHMILIIPKLSTIPYIIADYTGTLPFKKDDNITVYGEYAYPMVDDTLKGMEDVGLPYIKASYVEKTN